MRRSERKKHQIELLKAFGEKNIVCEYGGWMVFLRPQQITIGSLVISLWDYPAESIGTIRNESMVSARELISMVELSLKNELAPEKFNYLALMMVDPQVHFHVIPRYSRPVLFNEGEYADDAWPKPPNLQCALDLPPETRTKLFARLKDSLQT